MGSPAERKMRPVVWSRVYVTWKENNLRVWRRLAPISPIPPHVAEMQTLLMLVPPELATRSVSLSDWRTMPHGSEPTDTPVGSNAALGLAAAAEAFQRSRRLYCVFEMKTLPLIVSTVKSPATPARGRMKFCP